MKETMAKLYIAKGSPEEPTFVQVLQELDDEYLIIRRKFSENENVQSQELISKKLFATCVRTGYLSEVDESMLYAYVKDVPLVFEVA